MNELFEITLRQGVREGRVEWRKHVLQKSAERGLRQSEILKVLLDGELIRDYPDDRPFPSALFLGYVGSEAFHVVAACDTKSRQVYVITAYRPSLEMFEDDFKTRKKL